MRVKYPIVAPFTSPLKEGVLWRISIVAPRRPQGFPQVPELIDKTLDKIIGKEYNTNTPQKSREPDA